MFTPKSGNSNTRDGGVGNVSYSSASARAVASAAARRRSGVYNSAAKRSPFTTPGRTTPLNRSLQTSQLMDGSGQYILESYGAPLPAMIMEALTFAERNTEMSTVLALSGWAWLVCGRRLLIWRYRTDDTRRLANHQFRELTLPPSDLAHRSQLVMVFGANDNQVPSCIAVSPEGFVRYWPTIAYEGSYEEVSSELQGQECDSLLFLGPVIGCLLATTTSTTLLLQPGGSSGDGSTGGPGPRQISIRHLKVPAGILGGISRRVSSLMFGSMPTQVPEARLVRVLGMAGEEADERSVLVLSARSLHKWYLASGQPDRQIYECNVDKCIHEGFVDHVWGRDRVSGGASLHVWLIDMQLVPGTQAVMIMAAAVNPQISQQLVYALATLDVGSSSPPTSVANFCVLKHSEYYQESAEVVFLSQRFLLCGSTAYIYNKNSVLCVSVLGDGDTGDRVEFSGSGDAILGVGRSQGLPLFFSASHGIVSISSPMHHNQSSMLLNDSVAEDTSRLSEAMNVSIVGLDNITNSQDQVARLQAAFLHFNKSNLAQAQNLLDELFPGGDHSTLDGLVVRLSTNLIDDSPATDPRWAEANQGSGGTGAPMSLIILNQLKDKATAHSYFISFLQQAGLWHQLSIASVDDRQILTGQLLAEHHERLLLATALRTRHSDQQHLVDAAIRIVLNDRDEKPTGKLTHADLFYRRVSQVDDIVWGLMKAQEEVISADVAPRDAPATIHSVNTLLMKLLKASKEHKGSRVHTLLTTTLTTNTDLQLPEYIPWTSSLGPRGLRSLLVSQHNTTVEAGLSRAEDGATGSKLYAQLVELTDEVLTGYQPHLHSLSSLSQQRHQTLLTDYQKHRYNLLQPLVQGEQYDQAVGIAEKYCDFRTLVEICDRTNNQERLNQYMIQFGSQGFSDFVFRWYLETGKRGRLLAHSGDVGGRKDLARFLQDYSSLAWLHQVNTRDFPAAHDTLKQLAYDETAYLSRKKTLLSLSKLCKLVSTGSCESADGEEEDGRDEERTDPLNQEEDLILYQEQLPEPVLTAHSLNPDTMRVLSPIELIHMYIGEENMYANEFDFKKALDLLSFVRSLEDAQKLKLDIWIGALKRNTWEHLDTDSPIEAISDTTFFKTVELAFSQGSDVRELLIPANELLLSEDLGSLKDDTTFKFLVNAGYEKINQILG